jgi:hypothetical protein
MIREMEKEERIRRMEKIFNLKKHRIQQKIE